MVEHRHYHKFSQSSDYVEAVEGFTAEDEQDLYADDEEQEIQTADAHAIELDEDEYIEEEQQYTLNELYAQAQKQLLANGLGSKEDIRAWQALYPRLIGNGGNLTAQGLEQIVNLNQKSLTPQQAQQIFNMHQHKQFENCQHD